MVHLIRVIAVFVVTGSAFGCVTTGELRQLRQEVAALEERLHACSKAVDRAEGVLKDAGQKALNIQNKILEEQPTQVYCNDCINPSDTAQCARYCVIDRRTLWDPARPHPTESACTRLKKASMTLENAQDIYFCEMDAYTEGVAEMQERRAREEESKQPKR